MDALGNLLSEHRPAWTGLTGWFAALVPGARTVVGVHEDGLRVHSRRGDEAYPWDEVECLISRRSRSWLGGHPVTTFVLEFTGGRRVELCQGRHAEVDADVGLILRQKTHSVLWPRYRQTLDDKGSIRLGAVRIDRKALRTDTQEVPFKGLKTVERDDERLVFTHVNGTETRVDVREQPNVHLMIELAEHYRR